MKKAIKKFIFFLRDLVFGKEKNLKKIVFIIKNSPEDNIKFEEIKSRILYFDPTIEVERTENFSFLNKINNKFVVYIGCKPSSLFLKLKEGLIYNLDYENNYEDGWEYHRILTQIQFKDILKNRISIKNKLFTIKQDLKKQYDKAYIFGTGPSLEKALERTWDDGIRIVSNTIVKDKELWNHINPHFIVAGDAIYHYGLSDFAQAFRKDLAERLAETNTYFVFQEHFLSFVKKTFPQFHDRLIPIPVKEGKIFYNIIETQFELPCVGNVLNALLLPLACYLCQNVFLWGFDGRAPTDLLFWKNSDKHFYTDLVPQLQKLHPAFFNTLVPKENPSQYAQSVHGDVLNNMLIEAEKKGKKFIMMHKSYTKTLMDRYGESF